ncbi:hypothetical protein [Sorangium sp. So ce176]|uniref:hypothetical protein n=1 Tax=Sorangium sp. So ce176 TaxID=3133286 RepID=UPI003F5D7BFF
MHRGEHVARAQQHLRDFIRDLIADGAEAGAFRDDIAPDELAQCGGALLSAPRRAREAASRLHTARSSRR